MKSANPCPLPRFDSAAEAIRQAGPDKAVLLAVYKCPECGAWHVEKDERKAVVR